MKLYLVQHGEALSKEQDVERPLSEQGRRDVEHIAGFLSSAGVRVARIIHSGKPRAHQTADILAQAVQPREPPAAHEGLAPNDPVMPFADLVATWREDRLVVGHLPFMGRAVCLLLTGDEEHAVVGFRPGGLVCLERDEDGPWSLAWMMRPELLSA
jgi:phosphohistidine phosphatase